MSPQSSHDYDLMVFADWLEEAGRQEESDRVRDSLSEEDNASWVWEYRFIGVGGVGGAGGGAGGGVGGVGVGVGVGGGIGGVGVGGGIGGGDGVGSVGGVGVGGY